MQQNQQIFYIIRYNKEYLVQKYLSDLKSHIFKSLKSQNYFLLSTPR